MNGADSLPEYRNGGVRAPCPGCGWAISAFVREDEKGKDFGVHGGFDSEFNYDVTFRLMRCSLVR